jgi:hypothetical protein
MGYGIWNMEYGIKDKGQEIRYMRLLMNTNRKSEALDV